MSAARDFERSKAASAASPVAGPSVEKSTSPSLPSSTLSTTTKPKVSTTIIKPWSETTDVPKIWAYNRALKIFDDPFAFSLNLAADVIKAANENDRGQLDHIRRRVVRELKRALGREVPTWLILETDADGRLHLHGGLAITENEISATIDA